MAPMSSGRTFARRRDLNGEVRAWDTAYGTSPTASEPPKDPVPADHVDELRKLPRIPSMMNWTARAASTTPDNLLITLAPVTPSTFINRGAASISPQQMTITTVTTPRNPTNNTGLPQTSPAVSRIVARAPGPAMKGNASGKTEISWRLSDSSRSDVVERVPEGCANTISSEIKKSKVPPAIRKELSAIPMTSRNFAPAIANTKQIPRAMALDLNAMFLW